jgi:hypothetical protein
MFFVLVISATNLNAMKCNADEAPEDESLAKEQELSEPKIGEQKIFEITKIIQILEHLPQDRSSIVVFDYDDTLSPPFGPGWCENDEAHGTLATINKIHQMGYKTMVLTRRLHGQPYSARDSHYTQETMFEKLQQTQWLKNGALARDDLLEGKIEGHTIATKNQVCFSGGTHGKGKGLAFLIDNNCFKESPHNIVFIDDEKRNIESVKDAFSNRPENLFLFYYP